MWPFGSSDRIGEKPTTEPKPRLIQPGSVSLSGVQLETAVALRVMNDLDWTLDRMQLLMIFLADLHFSVSLRTCRSGWLCDIKRGDIFSEHDDCVQEFGENSPAIALARAALAAVREWPPA